MKAKQKLGYEPEGIDLTPIKSIPPTEAEAREMSAYIAQRKKLYAAQQRRTAARRARAAGSPAKAA